MITVLERLKDTLHKKVNNINGDLFEISEEDNGVNTLFRYIVLDWRIGGKKIRSNLEIIKNRLIDSISRIRGIDDTT